MALMEQQRTAANGNGSTTNTGAVPTPGRIVRYRVSGESFEGPAITQGGARRGELLPALVLKVIDRDVVNLRVFCDGPMDGYVQAINWGSRAGEWSWPERD